VVRPAVSRCAGCCRAAARRTVPTERPASESPACPFRSRKAGRGAGAARSRTTKAPAPRGRQRSAQWPARPGRSLLARAGTPPDTAFAIANIAQPALKSSSTERGQPVLSNGEHGGHQNMRDTIGHRGGVAPLIAASVAFAPWNTAYKSYPATCPTGHAEPAELAELAELAARAGCRRRRPPACPPANQPGSPAPACR